MWKFRRANNLTFKTSFHFRGREAFILPVQKLDLERFEVSLVAFDFGCTNNCLLLKSPFSLP
jgi:hypothetical protein